MPGRYEDYTGGKSILIANIPEKTSLRINTNKVEGDNKDDYVAQYADILIEPYQYTDSLPIFTVKGKTVEELLQIQQFKLKNPNVLQESDEGIYFICEDKVVGPFGFSIDQEILKLTGGIEKEKYQLKIINRAQITPLNVMSEHKEERTIVMSFISRADIRKAQDYKLVDYFSQQQQRDILLKCLEKSQSENIRDALANAKNELRKILAWHPSLEINRDRRMALFEKILSDVSENYEDVHEAVCDNIRNNENLANKVIDSLALGNPEKVIRKLFEATPTLKDNYLTKEESEKVMTENNRLRSDLEALSLMNKEIPSAEQSAELTEAKNKITELNEKLEKLEKKCVDLEDIHGNIEAAENTLKGKRQELETIQENLEVVASGFTLSLQNRLRNESIRLENKINEYKNDTRILHERLAALHEQEFGQWLESSVNSLITDVGGKITEAKGMLVGYRGQNEPTDNISETNSEAINEELSALPLMHISSESTPVDIGRQIISTVAQYLKRNGRTIANSDIANYLVCITQGFITTFAGKPGSGKTSLCNLLAESLGLKTSGKNTHFVDVSVARGWSSHKDFIGFYNPITESIVKTNEDVYDALMLSMKEDSAEAPPMLIMLDEANLSPLEHYWSAFLKNSDFDFKSNRKIHIGSDKPIQIPEHLRFLATINHDHTTEELSPRFLDRSWVVILDTPVEEFTNKQEANLPQCDAVPYSLLQKAFGAGAFDGPSESLMDKWNKVREEFKELQLNVMGRSFNMVMNYVCAAKHYMASETTALDYAIAQKVLPQLSVYGSEYKQRIEKAAKQCNNLSLIRCYKILSDIAKSSNIDVYQFFSR